MLVAVHSDYNIAMSHGMALASGQMVEVVHVGPHIYDHEIIIHD